MREADSAHERQAALPNDVVGGYRLGINRRGGTDDSEKSDDSQEAEGNIASPERSSYLGRKENSHPQSQVKAGESIDSWPGRVAWRAKFEKIAREIRVKRPGKGIGNWVLR